MAIRLPSNLYSGAAAVFNSQPEVNLYGQVLARQQAKFDAMDQYERSRQNSINDAGVRDIDRPAVDNSLSDLRQYYNANKKEIQKGNSQAAFDYEKKWRGIKETIAGSKERGARHEAALKFYNDRLKIDQRLPDDFMTELHYNDMPVGAKYVDQSTGEQREYQPFDITKWASEAKPFVQQNYLKSFNDIKRTPGTPKYEKIDGQPLKLTEIIEEGFDNGAKQVIAARAADRYDNSHSFSSQVQEEVKDPLRRKQLSDLFIQEYGVAPALPSDYATAYTLELLQPKLLKTKAVDDKDAIMTRREKFAREVQGMITSRGINLALLKRGWAQLDQEAQDEEVENVVAGYEKTGKVAPQITAEYEKKDAKGHPVAIEETIINPDGTYDFIVRDKDGGVDKDWSTLGVPRSQIKAKTRKVFETPITNTNTPVRTPKDIKQTKMVPKPTKPKPY